MPLEQSKSSDNARRPVHAKRARSSMAISQSARSSGSQQMGDGYAEPATMDDEDEVVVDLAEVDDSQRDAPPREPLWLGSSGSNVLVRLSELARATRAAIMSGVTKQWMIHAGEITNTLPSNVHGVWPQGSTYTHSSFLSPYLSAFEIEKLRRNVRHSAAQRTIAKRIEDPSHPCFGELGLFCGPEPIATGEIFGEYTGEIREHTMKEHRQSLYVHSLGHGYDLDAEKFSNEFRFINDYQCVLWRTVQNCS